jgi:two-component sensor histidine kinase
MRYAAAAACVCVSLIARILLHPLFHDYMAFTTFYPSIVLAAYFAGAGPAIFSAVLSAALGYLVFAAPHFPFRMNAQAIASLGFFSFTSSVEIYFITGMTRAVNDLRMERTRAQILAEGHANLFREFNERATNHLQLVAALLQVQARDEYDQDYSSALSEASKRSLLISQVHRSLYGEPQRRTDFAAFARQLLASSLTAAGGPPLTVEVEDQGIALPPDQATSLAVVLFECFRNVLARRHALRIEAFNVALKDEGDVYRLRLSIRSRDASMRGVQAPIEQGLPHQVVHAVTEQLKGAFSSLSGLEGPVYELVFPHAGSDLLLAPAAATDEVEPALHSIH